MIKLDINQRSDLPVVLHRLEQSRPRAWNSGPDHPLALEWHPFQLNPEMPAGGMDRRAYLELKFGGHDRRPAGLMPRSSNGRWPRVLTLSPRQDHPHPPHTLDAHRLIHWAGIEGRQRRRRPVALFRAYFIDGKGHRRRRDAPRRDRREASASTAR